MRSGVEASMFCSRWTSPCTNTVSMYVCVTTNQILLFIIARTSHGSRSAETAMPSLPNQPHSAYVTQCRCLEATSSALVTIDQLKHKPGLNNRGHFQRVSCATMHLLQGYLADLHGAIATTTAQNRGRAEKISRSRSSVVCATGRQLWLETILSCGQRVIMHIHTSFRAHNTHK